MPPIRIVPVPATTYYRARGTLKEVRPVAAGVIDQIIAGLTKPLVAEEASPKQLQREAQEKPIEVTAANFSAAAEKINALFLENHWSDGLPVVPPTDYLVNQMLKGTSRSPKEMIGLVQPKNGEATIKKIAINAVMAGAKPEYLPVIIAAMEGFTDKGYDLTHVQASTGSFVPAIIVTGPMAKELDFNTGIGFMGHGYRANATIGRALRLCLLNLGQTWPAVNDMALTGRPSSYTFYTFAEDEDPTNNPWGPEHTASGFKSEDSAVTVSTVGGNYQSLGGGAVAAWTAQGILDRLVSNFSRISTYLGGPYSMKHIVVFHPDCARELYEMGYKTRKSVQEYLYEQSRIPYSKLSADAVKELKRMVAEGQFRPDRAPVFTEALKEGGRVPVVQAPEDIHVFVSGGSPGYTVLFSYQGNNWAHSTKKITGATLTKAGQGQPLAAKGQ